MQSNLYDTTQYFTKPNTIGMRRDIGIVYGGDDGSIWSSETTLKTAVAALVAAGCSIICMDNETGDVTQLSTNVGWAKAQAPGALVGCFGYPLYDVFKDTPTNQSDNDAISTFLDLLDVGFTPAYAEFDMNSGGLATWMTFIGDVAAECNRVMPGKPSLPFISPYYSNESLSKAGDLLESPYFKEMSQACLATNFLNGAVVWTSAEGGWSSSFQWYQDLLSAVPPILDFTLASGDITSGLQLYITADSAKVSGLTAFDSSGNGLNATASSTLAIVPGKVNQALATDGTATLAIPDVANLNDFSIVMWAKITSGSTIFAAENFPTTPRNAIVLHNNEFEAFVNGTGNSDFSISLSDSGNFHSYAIVRQGTFVQLFQDNNLIGTEVVGAGTLTLTQMRIGSHYFSGADHEQGAATFDELRIYSRALSVADRDSIIAFVREPWAILSVAVFPNDLVVMGNFSSGTITLPLEAIGDSNVAASAGISASKLQQAIRNNFSIGSAATAATITEFMHLVLGATCSVIAVSAGCVVPCVGGATITVDIKKNGSSILSAVISLSSSQTARQAVTGVITTPAGVVGDVYEVVIVATTGGGTIGQGLFVELKLYEDPS